MDHEVTGAEAGFQTLQQGGDTDHHDFNGYETAQLVACEADFPSDKNNVNCQHQNDEHMLGASHQCRHHVRFFVGDKEHIARFFAGHVTKRGKHLI